MLLLLLLLLLLKSIPYLWPERPKSAKIACAVGPRKGRKGSKPPQEYWEERRRVWPARTLLFSMFFYVHQTDAKILICQILWITQSAVLIAQRSVIQERQSSRIHSFHMLTYVIMVTGLETLRSLEENEIKLVSFAIELMQRNSYQNDQMVTAATQWKWR